MTRALATTLVLLCWPLAAGAQIPVEQACGFTLPDDKSECAERTRAYEAHVSELQRLQDEVDIDHKCPVHCSLLDENLAYRRVIRRMSIRAIRSMSAAGRERRDARVAGIDAEAAALVQQRDTLEEEIRERARGRVIHLYQNDDTGALVEHAGKRFEPKPPLRYVGERRAPLGEAGQRRLRELEQQRRAIDGELEALDVARAEAAGSLDGDRSEMMIEQMWGQDCSAAEAQAFIEGCERSCWGSAGDPPPKDCPM